MAGGESATHFAAIMIKRIAFFAYGVICYAVFFGTFLYAIGFVGGFAVPKLLDGAPIAPLPVSLAIDLGLLALFAVQHSVMARPWFKEVWTKDVPKEIERSTYVLFSSVALLLMFWQWRPLGGVVWSVQSEPARVALRSSFAFGWMLVLVSTFLINHFDLFGLRQVWLQLVGKPYTQLKFGTPGPYKLVRHPLYVGWFFAFWSAPTMTMTHLLFAVMTTAYILVAIQFEERDLVRHHKEYADYRKRVPMLIPFTKRRDEAITSSRAIREGL